MTSRSVHGIAVRWALSPAWWLSWGVEWTQVCLSHHLTSRGWRGMGDKLVSDHGHTLTDHFLHTWNTDGNLILRCHDTFTAPVNNNLEMYFLQFCLTCKQNYCLMTQEKHYADACFNLYTNHGFNTQYIDHIDNDLIILFIQKTNL